MKKNFPAAAPIIALVLVSLLSDSANAELSVASPFTDNAVLQRAMPVPVWGATSPDSQVTVEFAGQKKSGQADSNGRWQIKLDPLAASLEPRELTVIAAATDEKLSIKNVVVGEVWICSGQSNMQAATSGNKAIKALIPKMKNLRNFTVKRTVAFTEQDRCQGQWKQRHPDSAVAFAFAYFLEQHAEVPVGIIHASWGSSSIEGWMPRDMTAKLPHFQKQMQMFDADTDKRTRIESILNGPKPWGRKNDIFLRRQSNIIYNAMMHPLAPLACRGIVWYQGEANSKAVGPMLQYGTTLPAWVQRYREEWGRDDLHFLVVMLPGFAKGLERQAARPDQRSWAWMRESQLKVLDLPHTSVANTVDLGHPTNIHPSDKLPIGKRLALLAARNTLGQDVQALGPVFKRIDSKGDRLIVHFDHATGLKTLDGKPPMGFWLADDARKWHMADAEIKGNSVVLSSSELSEPRHVRYAFAGKPDVNLVNEADLPAYPFRTDEFQP